MINHTEKRLIHAIAQRAADMYAQHNDGARPKPEYIAAILILVHEDICPLRLADLLDAQPGDFAHDIAGIRRHLDFTNSRLTDCFLPRFADLKRESA